MLSIGKLAAGQEGYYLALAAGVEDYYTGHGEPPGRWAGRAAPRVALEGQVAGDDLRAVFEGVTPSGAVLGRAGRRVPGFDLTFSAPKSVSVVYALGDGDVAGAVMA